MAETLVVSPSCPNPQGAGTSTGWAPRRNDSPPPSRIAVGYLQVNSDARARTDTLLAELSAVELHELLDSAGVPHPKSATKARRTGMAQPFADRIPDPGGDLYEPTPDGWDVARSPPARVADTARLWGAWGALQYDQGRD